MSVDNIEEEEIFILITGANSGLGLATCCRLIDEFLQTRPQSQRLVLIPTTRSQKKSDETVQTLHEHVEEYIKKAEKSLPGVSKILETRVRFHPEQVDLTYLPSVKALVPRLEASIPKLDACICNAGIGGWTGNNWPYAFYSLFTHPVSSVTWPPFKISGLGWKVKSQLPEPDPAEPPIGEVFCANVFGHYMLVHDLIPLLENAVSSRVMWLSSLEAYDRALDLSDIQCLESKEPYEGTKRLTDLLVLTSELSNTSPWTDSFFSATRESHENRQSDSRPRMYLVHPGICQTNILPIAWILAVLGLLSFYFARLLGSIWHTISPYVGAVSIVWVTLSPQELLDNCEEGAGPAKWGSCTDGWGNERVERTEVEGWGYGGILGDTKPASGRRRGRHPEAKDMTEEDHELFIEKGRQAWRQMEELRVEWHDRLKKATPLL